MMRTVFGAGIFGVVPFQRLDFFRKFGAFEGLAVSSRGLCI
jgi:hypothetical protein